MDGRIPRELLDGLVAQFDPQEIYLFGSHARGEARRDSDIDLYVIVDDEGAEHKLTTRAIARSRRAYRGAVDIFVARRSVFDRRKGAVGALANLIAEEGVTVYRRG